MDGMAWSIAAALIAGGGLVAIIAGRGRSRPKSTPDQQSLAAVESRPAARQQQRPGGSDRQFLRLFEPDNTEPDLEQRIDDRLAILDDLIREADEEIARLEATLAESRPRLAPQRPLTLSEVQRCLALREAGLTLEEIARCLQADEATIRAALDQWRDRPGLAA